MQRKDWKKIALLGLSGGILFSAAVEAQNYDKQKNSTRADLPSDDPNDGNMNYHMMSEEEFLLELTPENVAIYKSFDPKTKQLALRVASMMCAGSNECKGLNACQTDTHDCAGKGDCKGKGKCAISDKNLVIKLVKDKMAAKRNNAINQR